MSLGQYYPVLKNIIGITQAQECVVTFDSNHDFTVGEIIGLRSSRPFGMYEVNNLSVRVIAVTSDTVTLELDTTSFNAFVYPPVGTVQQPAVAVPSSSGIIPGLYTPETSLFDRFDHLAPSEVT